MSYLDENGIGNLETLDLSDSILSNEDLLWIVGHFPFVTDLNIYRTRVTATGIQHLAQLKNLRKLKLVGRTLPITDLLLLLPMIQLEHIDTGDMELSLHQLEDFVADLSLSG